MKIEEGENSRKNTSVLAFGNDGNAYGRSLYPALEAAGSKVTTGISSGRWLVANHRSFDCVHINWPSFFYAGRDKSTLQIAKDFARFVGFLAMFRLWNLRVYWTAHNLYPHDACPIPGLDWLVRRLVIGLSRKVFVHGPAAAAVLEREFPSIKSKVVLIDHGHWVGFYPQSCDRAEARKRLHLEQDEFVFLFVGICKEYKNLDGLLQAFEKIAGRVKLVIAGAFHNDAYRQQILKLVARQPAERVVLHDEFVPDDELQYYLTAADVVVLPYLEILTSGAAVLALSFGRPVVAPRRGHLIDLITSECGILYAPEQNEGLLSGMRDAMGSRFDEEKIMKRALQLDWRRTASRMADEFSKG